MRILYWTLHNVRLLLPCFESVERGIDIGSRYELIEKFRALPCAFQCIDRPTLNILVCVSTCAVLAPLPTYRPSIH